MMTNHSNKVLYQTLLKLLRPLVRILLHRGVSTAEFTEIVRRVYVSVAETDFGIGDRRKQTTSRIAVLTGLNRPEVARLREIDDGTDDGPRMFHNRATRVVSGWTSDARFAPEGVARDLPLEGPHSFTTLVIDYSGGMPVRAVLDELKRVGSVRDTEGGLLHLCAEAYIPVDGDDDKLRLMGIAASDLLNTLHHNVNRSELPSRFQIMVDNSRMSDAAIAQFRQLCDEKSLQLLKEFDVWLNAHATRASVADSSGKRKKTGSEKVRRVGVGIYFFEDQESSDE
jgi:hypothetical protein